MRGMPRACLLYTSKMCIRDSDSSAGRVRNSGLVQAATGDISLSGREVEQAGVLLSSSSVDSRGTLHLKASCLLYTSHR